MFIGKVADILCGESDTRNPGVVYRSRVGSSLGQPYGDCPSPCLATLPQP